MLKFITPKGVTPGLFEVWTTSVGGELVRRVATIDNRGDTTNRPVFWTHERTGDTGFRLLHPLTLDELREVVKKCEELINM